MCKLFLIILFNINIKVKSNLFFHFVTIINLEPTTFCSSLQFVKSKIAFAILISITIKLLPGYRYVWYNKPVSVSSQDLLLDNI